jgi:hypothetical protein
MAHKKGQMMSRFKFVGEEKSPEQSSELAGTALRTIGGSAARAAESVLGAPADILFTLHKLPINALLGLAKLVSGGKTPSYEDLENDFAKLLSGGKTSPPENEKNDFPTKDKANEPFPLTSQWFRKGTQALTGQHLEPQDELEQKIQETVGDIGSLVGGGAKSIGRAIAQGIGGKVAEETAKSAGISPRTAKLLKAGTQIGLGVIGTRKVVEKAASSGFDESRKIGKTINYNTPETRKEISSVWDSINKSSFKGKEHLRELVKSIEKSFDKNNINGSDLIEKYKETNNWFKSINDPIGRQYLHDVRIVLDKAIQKIGESSPSYSNNFNMGRELYKVLAEQKEGLIGGNIKEQLIDVAKKHAPGIALGAFAARNSLSGANATLAATALGAKELAKTGQLIYKSPHAANIYKQSFKESAKTTLPSLANIPTDINESKPKSRFRFKN